MDWQLISHQISASRQYSQLRRTVLSPRLSPNCKSRNSTGTYINDELSAALTCGRCGLSRAKPNVHYSLNDRQRITGVFSCRTDQQVPHILNFGSISLQIRGSVFGRLGQSQPNAVPEDKVFRQGFASDAICRHPPAGCPEHSNRELCHREQRRNRDTGGNTLRKQPVLTQHHSANGVERNHSDRAWTREGGG